MYESNGLNKLLWKPFCVSVCNTVIWQLMFIKKQYHNWLFILLMMKSISILAQDNSGCATVMSEQQMTWLRSLQKQLDHEPALFKKNTILYVPVKVHIVGKTNGTDHMRPDLVLEGICKANRDFASAGIYFYLGQPINYINDDDLFGGDYEAVYTTAADAKVENMLNIYYIGYSPTFCGVYFPFPDVVLVQRGCAQIGSTTLTHELGHFFSLPHTFVGWEGGNNLPISQREKIDGSNCRNTADGFCDTGPDYVSVRWSCPLSFNLTDPNGVVFKPDPTFYMNYASDGCHQRFSNEQIAAMRLNITSLRRWSFPAVDTVASELPILISPIQNDSNINPESVQLVWQNVDGAIGYLVQVTRYGFWEAPHVNRLVWGDTTVSVKLFDAWPFDWRVKAIMPGQVCYQFSNSQVFNTKPLPVGQRELGFLSADKPFPNPVKSGELIHLNRMVQRGDIKLYDMLGKEIYTEPFEAGGKWLMLMPSEGVYYLQYTIDNQYFSHKIIVW